MFTSETRLYTDNLINDRLKNKYSYDNLFTLNNTEEELLLPRIKSSIRAYGGKYWNPSEEDKELLQLILKDILCENILGLHD